MMGVGARSLADVRIVCGILLCWSVVAAAAAAAAAAGGAPADLSTPTPRITTTLGTGQLQTVRCGGGTARHILELKSESVDYPYVAKVDVSSDACNQKASFCRQAILRSHYIKRKGPAFLEMTSLRTTVSDLFDMSYYCLHDAVTSQRANLTSKEVDVIECKVQSDAAVTYSADVSFTNGEGDTHVSGSSLEQTGDRLHELSGRVPGVSRAVYVFAQRPGYTRLVLAMVRSPDTTLRRPQCRVRETGGLSREWTDTPEEPASSKVIRPPDQNHSPIASEEIEDSAQAQSETGEPKTIIVVAAAIVVGIVFAAVTGVMGYVCGRRNKKKSEKQKEEEGGGRGEDEGEEKEEVENDVFIDNGHCRTRRENRQGLFPFPIAESQSRSASTI